MGVLLSLGSINADFQMRIERWPEAGETMTGGDFLLAGGGKGANVALIGRRLGVPACLIGRTGDDDLAAIVVRPLKEAGVDLDHTRRLPGEATGSAAIMVQPDGEKGIFLALNANRRWGSREEQTEAAAAVSDAPDGSVLVADLEVPVEVVRRCMEAARQRKFPTVLDPSPAPEVEEDLIGLADYVTPNPSEARHLCGIRTDSPDAGFRVGEKLRARGAGCVLAKLPDGGCAVTCDGERFFLEAGQQVSVVDKTGAGDAFAGALAVGLLERRPLRDAVRMAIAAAGIAVGRYGSQAAYPDRPELDSRLAV